MTKHPVPARLADFATGTLGPEETAEIESHLESCESCSEYVDKLPNSLAELLRRDADAQGGDQFPGPPPSGPSDDATTVPQNGTPGSASNGATTVPGCRFRIVKPHACGGLGEVFVAEDLELHREVAVKEIRKEHADDPDSRGRFVLEAEITGRLEHPGIVAVYGLGQYEDGRPYYAMRFIKGDNLKEAIERFHQDDNPKRDATERTLAFRDLLGRFVDVCNAVGYAHSRGILHRDLKPGNVMLGKYGETLVVDWGLAKPVDRPDNHQYETDEGTLRCGSTDSEVAATVMGSAVGTPAFMSPEQAAGRIDLLCPASDIYSLGATLYVLLTGQVPFKDRDLKEVLRKVQHGDFVPPRRVKSSVPTSLDAICRKAMALRRENRYQSALELAADIEHWLADEPVTAWPEPVHVKAGRWMRRHKPLVSGMAAALVVGAVSLAVGYIWHKENVAEAGRKQAILDADEARKQAIAAERMHQSLNQAQHKQIELHKTLMKSGGVQFLLSRPNEWQAQISTGRAHWQQAKDLMAHAEYASDTELTNVIVSLGDRFTRDQADHALAVRLENIRLEKAIFIEGKRDNLQFADKYQTAFGQSGLGTPAEMAANVRKSMIKDQLVAALDDWARLEMARNRDLSVRIFQVARDADSEPWRDALRASVQDVLRPNVQTKDTLLAIQKQIDSAQADRKLLETLSPQSMVLASELLPESQKISWLRMAQTYYPADFWINANLALTLHRHKDFDAAIGFYRAALAVRPNDVAVYSNLGLALLDKKDYPAATDALWKAVSLDPKVGAAWNNLGMALRMTKNPSGAMDAYGKALAIDPKASQTWYNLGQIYRDRKDFPKAIDAYKKSIAANSKNAQAWVNLGLCFFDRNDLLSAMDAFHTALEIDPKEAKGWYNLGLLHYRKKDYPAAIDAFKSAVAADQTYAFAWYNLGMSHAGNTDLPAALRAYEKAIEQKADFAEAHCNRGLILRDLGDFAEACKALEAGHRLGTQRKGWANPSAKWLSDCRMLLVMDKKIPAVIQGEAASADALLKMANISSQYKRRYVDAAELYARAFMSDPKLAEDLSNDYRYYAACAAAMASAGKTKDGAQPNAKEQARLRKHALEWLRADLTARANAASRSPDVASRVVTSLRNWQRAPDLSCIRDESEIAKLPAEEQTGLRKLWADVETFIKQTK